MKLQIQRRRSNQSSTTTTQTAVLALLGFQSILAIFHIDLAQACGPGRAGGRRHPNRYRKYTPLVQRQYFPNTGENTLGASGRPEGAIGRRDKRFKELVQNWNPDIEFRDDERTGADRMMSQRLKEKLSVLAISVMNQWPNVKLRVIEGWDEDYRHSMNSLHYEGRAVDITTSDKDKSKYGMLARLAVEAGFDWVHYESRSHVHCSVRSERADDVRNNGCFDAKGLVETPMGQMEMSQLQTNDMVLTMNSLGELQFSPVLMWLDRAELNMETFVELQTKSGRTIRLTSSHLIYLSDEPMPGWPEWSSTNDLNANKSHPRTGSAMAGNNFYYYDTISTGAQSVPSESERPLLVDTQPPPSSDLKDYVYTAYARNALVGQYLLITSPTEDPQVNFKSASYSNLDTARGSGANRLSFAPRQNHLASLDWDQSKPKGQGSKMRRSQSALPEAWTKTRVKFDQIVSVNFTTSRGIYAPLTREGNIVVNRVVASCYAVISDHDMAHLSMAPVRWLSLIYEKIFGLRPETPALERTIDFVIRREQHERRIMPSGDENDSIDRSRDAPNYQTNNSLDRTRTERHIHWYPILLYNIARFVLPTAYLY